MSKEALTLALAALEDISTALREEDVLGSNIEMLLNAITAIKEALAQQHLQDLHDENVHLGLYADEFCDANCTWSDHHPDCKYGTQNSDELTIAYMSGLYDGKKQANPEQEPVAFESLLGAIARGWCHEKNANKEMDSDLAIAIAAEVKAIYTTPPQPEQEPVAYFNPQKGGFYWAKPTTICAPHTVNVVSMPLYTAPPQRTWVELTEEEILKCFAESDGTFISSGRAIEAKLKEKNT